MFYILLGFVGLLVSVSVNERTVLGGYEWIILSPNFRGMSMALMAVGVLRILREIQQGIEVQDSKRYHLGLPKIKRSTLADANQKRSYQIFESLFVNV